jgi:leader peptidase (prepilin peptidase)/N-methyltransferase
VIAALVAVAGLVGLLTGSFLNVVIWRVPRGESVVRPPSACPVCHRAIRPYDNIPVLSWIALRGRCRDCGSSISVRYPLVELGTGVAFAATAWLVGAAWVLPALLYLVSIGVALALIDIDTHRLPDAIVLPAYVVAPVLLTLASANPGGDGDWGALVRALVGGGALWLFYFVLMLIYPAGMGFGDVKLAGILGLYLGWFGWAALLVGGFAAFLLGGLYAIGLVSLGRAQRKSGLPFGPWMLLGTAVGIVAGSSLAGWYLGIL